MHDKEQKSIYNRLVILCWVTIIGCYTINSEGKELFKCFKMPRDLNEFKRFISVGKSRGYKFIMHNGKFDTVRILWSYGIDIPIDHDTMIQAYLLSTVDELKDNRGKWLGLKYVAQRVLGVDNWDIDTSKLWIKLANAPSKVEITNKLNGGNETLYSGIASLPNKIYKMGCASVGTKIYLFGGNTLTTSIMIFNTEDNTLETLSTTLTQANYGMGCVNVRNKIYLLGGYQSSSINRFSVGYDVENNTLVLLNQNIPNKLPIINDDNLKVEIGIGMALLGNADNVGEEVEYSIYDGTEWT